MNYTVALATLPCRAKARAQHRCRTCSTGATRRLGLSVQQHGDPRRNAARLPSGAQRRLVARDRRAASSCSAAFATSSSIWSASWGICTTAISSASRRRWKVLRCWRAPKFASSSPRSRRCSCAFATCRSRCWRWRPKSRAQLHTAGVRTIGLLLELPRDAVIKRFGPAARQLPRSPDRRRCRSAAGLPAAGSITPRASISSSR